MSYGDHHTLRQWEDQRFSMRHTLKSWAPFFEHTLTGAKRFDVRRDDRDFQVGDEVMLVELFSGADLRPTGRTLVRRIVYILGRTPHVDTFGLQPGFVVLGLAP